MLWKGIPAPSSHDRPWWGAPRVDPAAAASHKHSLKPSPPLLGQGCSLQVPTHPFDVGASLLPWDGHEAGRAALLPDHSLVVCM